MHARRSRLGVALAGTGVAAIVALTTPGAALGASSPIDIPVPDGKVEHNITEETFNASYTIPDLVPRRERIEEWLSRDFGHVVITNLDTGKVRSECIQGWGTVTCVGKDGRTSFPAPEDGELVYNTQAEKYAWFRRSVDKGWLLRGADTTFQGRTVQVWNMASDAPRDPEDAKSEDLVDADAKLLLRRMVRGTGNREGGTFEQVETLLKHEVYSADSHRGRNARAAARRSLKRAKKVKRRKFPHPAPSAPSPGASR